MEVEEEAEEEARARGRNCANKEEEVAEGKGGIQSLATMRERERTKKV